MPSLTVGLLTHYQYFIPKIIVNINRRDAGELGSAFQWRDISGRRQRVG